MLIRIRRTALCACLMLTGTVVGCSGSGGTESTAPPPPGGSRPSPTSGAGGPGGVNAATTKAIANAFRVFFDSDTSVAQSVAALQHGPAFRTAVAAESKSPNAQRTTAKVTKVTLTSDKVATVTYSIISSGTPVFPNAQGFAVREGDRWKVSAQTFCALLTLEGNAPPACEDSSLTALPG